MPSESVVVLLDRFRFLLGRWAGSGSGLWNPGSPFRYREELLLEAVPERALIHFQQRTFEQTSGALSHAEQGFLRIFQNGEVELVVAVPAGYTEIHVGRLDGLTLQLEMVSLGVAPRARALTRTRRQLELREDGLHHSVEIGVGDGAPAAHVASVLTRMLPGEDTR